MVQSILANIPQVIKGRFNLRNYVRNIFFQGHHDQAFDQLTRFQHFHTFSETIHSREFNSVLVSYLYLPIHIRSLYNEPRGFIVIF